MPPAVQRLPLETEEAFALRQAAAEEDRQARIIRSAVLLAVEERIGDLRVSHVELGAQVGRLSVELEANSALTRSIEANTAELVKAIAALKGFVEVCGWVGTAITKLAPPVAVVAAAAAALWGGYVTAKAAVSRWWP